MFKDRSHKLSTCDKTKETTFRYRVINREADK